VVYLEKEIVSGYAKTDNKQLDLEYIIPQPQILIPDPGQNIYEKRKKTFIGLLPP
jgi:hypothetical protein